MARARHVVVLALVLFAIVGLAYAAEAPQSSSDDSESDEYDDVIGTSSEDSALSPNSVVAAPVGGPVPPGAFDTQAPAPNAASSLLHVSTVAGAATTALAGFFYF